MISFFIDWPAITVGKCDQEKVWRIVAKEDSFDIQGKSFLFFFTFDIRKEKKTIISF